MEIPSNLISVDFGVLENTLRRLVAHVEQNEQIVKGMREELNNN